MAFNLGDVLKNVSNLDTAKKQIVELPISSMDSDAGNFYELRDIDALADNISVVGLQQPILVHSGDQAGRYTIISGHRRLAACKKLAEADPEHWQEIPCIIEADSASPALQQLRLIYANANTRQLTSAEISEQAQQVEKLLYDLKEEGYEFPGRMRDHVAEAVGAIVPKVLQRIASASGKLMQAFLAPVLAFYFLRDRELFCFQLSLLIPLQQRKKLLTALREMRREIAGYLRGQLLVSSAVGILTAIGLLIVGVPAWLLLGIVMGVCDLIPYVGPYLGGIPIVLFSLPQGLYTVLWAVVAVVAVQQAESMFLSPQLMSGVTGLHPAYVLLLLSAGGLLGGIAGMLLSLPLYVCARGAVRALQCAARENAP